MTGNVTAELLLEHPILELNSSETNKRLGVVKGEVLGYRCIECGVADEDVFEMVHENGCTLEHETQPTEYADRPTGPIEETDGAKWMATDGGETDDR